MKSQLAVIIGGHLPFQGALCPQAVKLGEVAMAAGYAGASRESYA